MAEGKKSFIAYVDWIQTFEELEDDEAGKLVKHLWRYVNDMNPETDDKLIKMCFIPIKAALKRDLIKYENIIDRNKINGSKGGRPKKPKKPNGLNGNPKEPKKPDSDNDSDSDSKYVYSQFYDEQLELSENNQNYLLLIKWLFGDNIYKRPLEKVLNMKEQLSWKQFDSLLEIHRSTGLKIRTLLEELENWLMKNPKAKNSTVLGTLRTFAKRSTDKK